MGETARMVINDPSTFSLLTTDLKEQIIKGAINTVNMEAALTRRNAMANIKEDFTLRNTWTTRQIQFTQMPLGRYSLGAIQSSVGVTDKAAYMERQEVGGKHEPASGGTLSIPTNVARGGTSSSAVQKKFRLSDLKKLKLRGEMRATTDTHKSRQVARAIVAFREGKVIQYGGNLHFVDRLSIQNGRVEFHLRQVYGFDKPSTETPKKPWLLPAYEKVAKDTENIFLSQMKKLGM